MLKFILRFFKEAEERKLERQKILRGWYRGFRVSDGALVCLICDVHVEMGSEYEHYMSPDENHARWKAAYENYVRKEMYMWTVVWNFNQENAVDGLIFHRHWDAERAARGLHRKKNYYNHSSPAALRREVHAGGGAGGAKPVIIPAQESDVVEWEMQLFSAGGLETRSVGYRNTRDAEKFALRQVSADGWLRWDIRPLRVETEWHRKCPSRENTEDCEF